MDDPYSHIDSKIPFFDEGSAANYDLLTRQYDKNIGFGEIETMIEAARRLLACVPSKGVRALLRLGDLLVENAANDGVIVSSKGRVEWSEDIAQRVSHISILPLVLSILTENEIVLGSEQVGSGETLQYDFEATPERFSAAYILRAIFSALDFGFPKYPNELSSSYLMSASAVYGVLLAMQNGKPLGMHEVVAVKIKQDMMTRLSDARHAENRELAREVLEWWSANKNVQGMTKDRAADAIAGKIVPLSWRTVRDQLKGL